MKLKILVADQFEGLVSGKMLAMGLFADGVIVLNPGKLPDGTVEPAPYSVNLAVLCTLTDLPSSPAEGSIEIFAPPPDSERVAHLGLGPVSAKPGRSLSVSGRLMPFLAPRAGSYTVRARVGEAEATDAFEVRIEPVDRGPSQPAVPTSPAESVPVTKNRRRALKG